MRQTLEGVAPGRLKDTLAVLATALAGELVADGELVPEVGLEPTLAEANTALNRARLPIPPLRQSRDQRD